MSKFIHAIFRLAVAITSICALAQAEVILASSPDTDSYAPVEIARTDHLTVFRHAPGFFILETEYKEAMYIIEGSESALLIDTGTYCPALDSITSLVTSKPYRVVLTHNHPDHSGTISLFDHVYLHPADTLVRVDAFDNYKGHVNFLADGDTLSLGNKTIEILHVPGHTPGSIALLDPEAHMAITGDAFGSGMVWLMLEPHVPMSTYVESCQRMRQAMAHHGINKLYCGHYPWPKKAFGEDYIVLMQQLATRISQGDTDGATPYLWYGEPRPGYQPMTITSGEAEIVFNAVQIN